MNTCLTFQAPSRKPQMVSENIDTLKYPDIFISWYKMDFQKALYRKIIKPNELILIRFMHFLKILLLIQSLGDKKCNLSPW